MFVVVTERTEEVVSVRLVCRSWWESVVVEMGLMVVGEGRMCFWLWREDCG